MTKSFFTSALFAVGAALTISGGCSSDESGTGTVCNTGDTRTCVGEGACQGGQECLPDGSGFGPCRCGGATGGAAGSTDAGVSGGSSGQGGSMSGGTGAGSPVDAGPFATEDPPCIPVAFDCSRQCPEVDVDLDAGADVACCGQRITYEFDEFTAVRLHRSSETCPLCPTVVSHLSMAPVRSGSYRVTWNPDQPQNTGWYLATYTNHDDSGKPLGTTLDAIRAAICDGERVDSRCATVSRPWDRLVAYARTPNAPPAYLTVANDDCTGAAP